jgi:putative oxidoreductase
MSPIRSLARPLLAGTFIAGGASALRSPGSRVELARKAGLQEPEKLVRINAATMVAGGLALATGRLPRVSALTLAATLVPTTVVGHPFWDQPDKAAAQAQRTQFLKNLSVLGGLLLAAADTGGRESLPRAAGRVSSRAGRKASKAARRVERSVTS